MDTMRDALLDAIDHLDTSEQAQLLDYARMLLKPQGETVAKLIQHAQAIAFPREDLDEIAGLIEDEFEVVEGNELDVPDLTS